MDTQIEVRFYCAEKFEGAKQDGSGWYTSIDFLPPSTADLAVVPDHKSVVVLYHISLPPRYIGDRVADHRSSSDQGVISYTGDIALNYNGRTIVCAGAEYGDVLDVVNNFLRKAQSGLPISFGEE